MPNRTRKSTKPKGKRHATASGKAGKPSKVSAQRKAPSLPPVTTPHVGKFDPKYIQIAHKMALHGFIDREIADAFSVDETTLHRWKRQHPEFAKALKLGKEIPDERVKRSLYNRAVGYSYDSEQLFVDKFGTEHRMPTVTHVPPDTTACIFFLKNRDPDNWRDRQEHYHELVTTPEMLRLARARAGLTQSVVAEQHAA
jgi:hypothetical protein